MSFQQVLFLSAALSALSVGAAEPQEFTKGALRTAIEEAARSEGVVTCNPFVEVGCHFPVPQTPKGCTDCAPGDQLSDFLAQDGTILLPNDLTIDGTQIEVLPSIGEDAGAILSLPAQIGY
ncbi:MAG: hypothetical protein ACRBB0_11355 [Pelagimonas sp.]|uniref:hypothetical protein n=1 Tax=Pelagimonas sp. TaxID=2073170 RepID=UPI003D6C521B